MGVQRLAGCGVDACGVDADELHAKVCEALDGGRFIRGQLGIPAVDRHALVGAHQHARRQVVGRMGNVLPADQRACADRMDHAAWADVGVERHMAGRFALRIVMQWRIGVRAHMRRERDRRHVDRAARRDRGVPLLRVFGVAGEDGRADLHGCGDVPDARRVAVVAHVVDAEGRWRIGRSFCGTQRIALAML